MKQLLFTLVCCAAVGLVSCGCTKEPVRQAGQDPPRLLRRGEAPKSDLDIIMNRETNKVATEEMSFVKWTDGYYNVRWGGVRDKKVLPDKRPFGGESRITHLWELEWFSSLEIIQDYEFFDCAGLRVVVLPAAVRSIGDRAFHNCRRLDSLYLRGAVPPVLHEAAFDVKIPVIVVPEGTGGTYKAAPVWKKYKENIVEGR